MQDQYDLEENLLIALVIYEMKINDSPSFNSIMKASSQKPAAFFICDNSKISQPIPSTYWTIIYHHDPSNPGVSKSYNEAFKTAKQLNKKWLLLADQDTEFPPTIFYDYSNAITCYPQIGIFAPCLFDSQGLVSPFELRWGKGKRLKTVNETVCSFKKFKIINSGMLISLDAFEKAGGYDERFPMDYSDVSFLDRVCKSDPHFVLTPSRCHHHFSATEKVIDLSTELDRFKSFCKAVQLYKKTSASFVSAIWIIVPRALKLSLQMKSLKFLKIVFAK
jgi:rhamnosyltransferase